MKNDGRQAAAVVESCTELTGEKETMDGRKEKDVETGG